MKIALNLIGYLPGCGGVETYLLNLLAALQQVDRENNFLVLCDEPAAPALPIRAENFQVRTLTYQKNSIRGLLRGAVQRLTGKDILWRKLAGLDVDLMHHPLTILNPPGLPYPSVLTFHDMQQEYLPMFFSKRELIQRRKTYQSSANEASAIITVSQHVKNCLVETYAIEPSKIHVIYSGCGSEFRPRETVELVHTARHFKLDRPFMFYPAATWPHKNHLRLLQAISIMRERSCFDGELILTGSPMSAQQEVLDAISRLGLNSTVRWLDFLPKETVPYIYNLANLTVFPSLFEGFGLPVVEAMASGCPVVCSDSSSLPEVGGTAAVYFDPLNVDDMVDKLSRTWNDKLLREQLRRQGREQSILFNWENTAIQTVEIYRGLMVQ